MMEVILVFMSVPFLARAIPTFQFADVFWKERTTFKTALRFFINKLVKKLVMSHVSETFRTRCLSKFEDFFGKVAVLALRALRPRPGGRTNGGKSTPRRSCCAGMCGANSCGVRISINWL